MTVPAPAATVVLLRESGAGLEVLLLRRNARLAFHGGAWVFPGGRVDPGDDHGDGEQPAARRAAAREAREEAGVDVDPGTLHPLSHWTTPEGRPRRFSTWFFVGAAGDEAVSVDGGEIDDHAWHTPDAALAEQAADRIELPPPTFVTLTTLRGHRRIDDVLADVQGREPPVFEPRIVAVPGGECALYPGDAGWATTDPDVPGSRHRLLTVAGGWRYLR
ncbi:NUDIX domain-containing protein [Baekduia soli]|uniref:NUDIX domain-containing protein n=1 Tax=Baekduia soli TaxID=496014 RepID=A0A5B8UCM1_9ACTN|nr:NUDIX domain-containing protein [Baekduia soli]